MRADASGLFWQDIDAKIERKQDLLKSRGWVEVIPGYWAEQWRIDKGEHGRSICIKMDIAHALEKGKSEKREPPEPVWLEPGYLPNLEVARNYQYNLFTDEQLADAGLEHVLYGKKHELVFDIECYPNYYLIAFMSVKSRKVVYFELADGVPLNIPKLSWVFKNFTVIGFNSWAYDLIIAAMSLAGCSNLQMKSATSAIIEFNERGSNVLKHYKAKKIDCDHIDLINPTPLSASLKIYGGRMHAPRMQDLPFPPDTVLSLDQITITRWYCINDLETTLLLYQHIEKEMDLRVALGKEYGIDLRSKSDAQIAEAVIRQEVENLNRARALRPNIEPGTQYGYRVPHFMQFRTPMMQQVLNFIAATPFVVGEHGNIDLPQQIKDIRINIGSATYQMGIGGLHSTEKSTAHFSDSRYQLFDRDVTSYYPFIILNLGLYPYHLGPNFLIVYRGIVNRRIEAKKAGNKTVADSLKITINGSFGKLGSKYSVLYSPDLLIQVTVTGQLSLLMLIERLELAGIPVVSANTDGIVIKCQRDREKEMDSIVAMWEADTGFETEATLYSALFSRDVNNYVAVKDPSTLKDGESPTKTKGVFARADLKKTPQNEICVEAIEKFLTEQVPIERTIRACTDIRKFVNVRTVKGGAVKDGEFLGKAIRWYYARGEGGEIVYAKSGNKVPRSEGAKPLMLLPETLPDDIDYEWYEKETLSILRKIDYPL